MWSDGWDFSAVVWPVVFEMGAVKDNFVSSLLVQFRLRLLFLSENSRRWVQSGDSGMEGDEAVVKTRGRVVWQNRGGSNCGSQVGAETHT